MLRKPSCVKASKEAAVFINSLKRGGYLWRIVNSGLDVLRENMFAGSELSGGSFLSVMFGSMG